MVSRNLDFFECLDFPVINFFASFLMMNNCIILNNKSSQTVQLCYIQYILKIILFLLIVVVPVDS